MYDLTEFRLEQKWYALGHRDHRLAYSQFGYFIFGHNGYVPQMREELYAYLYGDVRNFLQEAV
jgi:hypothetical protein